MTKSCISYWYLFFVVDVVNSTYHTDHSSGPLHMWLGGVVVRALDLRLEIAGSIPAAALSSATLNKLFTRIVQHL